MEDILKKKLSDEQKQQVLSTLFGFTVDDGIIFDDMGREFYGVDSNVEFDLSTLHGIFEYGMSQAQQQGYRACQRAIREQLGL